MAAAGRGTVLLALCLQVQLLDGLPLKSKRTCTFSAARAWPSLSRPHLVQSCRQTQHGTVLEVAPTETLQEGHKHGGAAWLNSACIQSAAWALKRAATACALTSIPCLAACCANCASVASGVCRQPQTSICTKVLPLSLRCRCPNPIASATCGIVSSGKSLLSIGFGWLPDSIVPEGLPFVFA
jgi:hypothetical protein